MRKTSISDKSGTAVQVRVTVPKKNQFFGIFIFDIKLKGLTRTRMAVPLLSGIEVFCKNFAFPFELGPVRPPTPELTFYGGSFSV